MLEIGTFCFYSGEDSYCPDSSNEAECASKDQYFFCKQSKTCILEAKKCDGVVHCIKGEDEAIENCLHLYHQNSNSLTCIEPNRPADDVWIKAIKCNGKTECKNGEDEDPKLCKRYEVSKIFLRNNPMSRIWKTVSLSFSWIVYISIKYA